MVFINQSTNLTLFYNKYLFKKWIQSIVMKKRKKIVIEFIFGFLFFICIFLFIRTIYVINSIRQDNELSTSPSSSISETFSLRRTINNNLLLYKPLNYYLRILYASTTVSEKL